MRNTQQCGKNAAGWFKDSKKKAEKCRDKVYTINNKLRYENSQLY